MSNETKMNRIKKTVKINIIAVSTLIILPALVYGTFKRTVKSDDKRAALPPLASNNASKTVLDEYRKLPLAFWSFSGWRRKNIKHKYTQIDGEYNTRKSSNDSVAREKVGFFGGSTIWGVGVSDDETIPSYYHHLNKESSVVNYGESGWNTRQSLNLLLDIIGDENKLDTVIFYDGINDVLGQCRGEIKRIPAHSKETRFDIKLNSSFKRILFDKLTKLTLAPYETLITSNQAKSIDKLYDCDNNEKKANKIADHLLNNWFTVYLTLNSRRIDSYFILQPHAHATKSNTAYLDLNSDIEKEIKKQLDVVYPKIRTKISEKCDIDPTFCKKIIDGSSWLDVNESIYIDNSHINARGNKIIASKITEFTNERKANSK